MAIVHLPSNNCVKNSRQNTFMQNIHSANVLGQPEKEFFLTRLLSKGQHKYCRYNGLPLRYAGGKSLGVGYVIEHIPDGINGLVSPFFGGGSIEIAFARELGLHVKGYDVFDILTNYWIWQIKSPEKLANTILKWKPTKKQYAEVKERLRQHWKGENSITDDG